MVKITRLREDRTLLFIPFIQGELRGSEIIRDGILSQYVIKYNKIIVAIIHFMVNEIKVYLRDEHFLSDIKTACEKYENFVNRDDYNIEVEIIIERR